MPFQSIRAACVLPIVSCLLFILVGPLSASLVSSGVFSATSGDLGDYVAGSTTFNLTASQLALLEMDVDFDLIDDGVEVRINGTSLFVSQDTSQFGGQDFQSTGIQPNDIADPWTANSNGLPRLNVFASSSGVAFTGATTTSASDSVEYLPLFAVTDFTSLLVAGSNTIEFVNHNSFQGAELQGDYRISTRTVPEPATTIAPLVLACSIIVRRVRR